MHNSFFFYFLVFGEGNNKAPGTHRGFCDSGFSGAFSGLLACLPSLLQLALFLTRPPKNDVSENTSSFGGELNGHRRKRAGACVLPRLALGRVGDNGPAQNTTARVQPPPVLSTSHIASRTLTHVQMAAAGRADSQSRTRVLHKRPQDFRFALCAGKALQCLRGPTTAADHF